MSLNESIVESAALDWFAGLGYAVAHGPHLAPGEPAAERDSFGDVLLVGRLRDAIARLNQTIPAEAREDALRRVVRISTPSLIQTNRAFHKLLRDGVEVEYRRPDGSIAWDRVRLVDFTNPAANDWLVVNPAHEMRQPRVERATPWVQRHPRRSGALNGRNSEGAGRTVAGGFALSGLGDSGGLPDTQGVALGYLMWPRGGHGAEHPCGAVPALQRGVKDLHERRKACVSLFKR